ncbi:ribosome small subunit-dependent GTPase A [Desulfofundulus thermocisternus]|jgi:ribosome biogenesis GTPase|uniref:ribosome small subunit-dependent GTPase A n=1 Tax=Desulfofundulus thermocisternus TaxID=42471 RepID=UPI000487DB8A|nr:ribosome small subunit-dependent GTPase A [Desulfofundulus thermocisternus]
MHHEGTVIKACGGHYYVSLGEEIYDCAVRGRLRREKQQILVGDRVIFSPHSCGQGVIEDICPRQTRLVRPPVANVDRALIVFSVKEPPPNTFLLDRFLVQAQHAGVNPAICFNKVDLGEENIKDIYNVYRRAGYPVVCTSTRDGRGLEELSALLKGHITVLAGPSGVGKSSLLNALIPGLNLKTGEVSRKLGRGRHTTRHVELLRLPGGGLVADTPGFSSLYLPEIKREELGKFYLEFLAYQNDCRFNSCLHFQEPGCAVKEAVRAGEISTFRYENYVQLLQEVMELERRYW